MNFILDAGMSFWAFFTLTILFFLAQPWLLEKAALASIQTCLVGVLMVNVVVFGVIGALWWQVGFWATLAGAAVNAVLLGPVLPWLSKFWSRDMRGTS